MGSGQSARKLTISNEEALGVIQVSNAVVQRLKQADSETASGTAQEVRPATPSVQSSTPTASRPTPSGEPPSGYPVYYYPDLTLTALQIQQQKERELHNMSLYWQKRLYDLENNLSNINRIMDEEYKKAIQDLHTDGKKTVKTQNNIQPCMANRAKVLKCYQDHPKEILVCDGVVEEFISCLDGQRPRMIRAQC